LGWGTASAWLAAATGYGLSLSGDYAGDILSWHQWLGFSTALASAMMFGMHRRGRHDAPYFRPLFAGTVLLLVATGHLGGSLTHGEDFLFGGSEQMAADPKGPVAVDLDRAELFETVILPVLRQKCGNCHSPSRKKGGLVLLSEEGIAAGGENGPVIRREQLELSALLTTLHLPLSDDMHMPPKSKTQLSEHELALLSWWVRQGAPFGKTVAEAGLPADLHTVVAAGYRPVTHPLESLPVTSVSTATLEKLRAKGFFLLPLAQGSPLLQLSLQGRKDLSPDKLRELKGVGPNVVQLNLADTEADDALVAVAADLFPHLNRLHLERTAVTDKGIESLGSLALLEYLNLHQTAVSDAGLASLGNLPLLRAVYLWQTQVTEEGLTGFQSRYAGVYVNRGVDTDSLFGAAGLKPPVFVGGTELFADSVRVELSAGYGGADIFFTLDGTDPDTSSQRYDGPLVLTASTTVKACAFKPGWTVSGTASRSFVRIRHKVATIRLEKEPSDRYAGNGPGTLVDLTRGGSSFRESGWLGFEGYNSVATLDLGEEKAFSRVSVGAYEDTGAWIFFPKGLRISVSTDGVRFRQLTETQYPVATGPTQPSARLFVAEVPQTSARYVKVETLSVRKNPDWHPGAGNPCWVFIDEIVLE
jgi:mono/diheme cytochrome c family protein